MPIRQSHTPDLLPPPADPALTYALTANGRTAANVSNGNCAFFRVRPGQRLLVKVVLTVPKPIRVTALWLGITTGLRGYAKNRPVGLKPILAHPHQALGAGQHTFRLHWRIPKLRRGAVLLLISAWSSPRPTQEVDEPIARLIVN